MGNGEGAGDGGLVGKIEGLGPKLGICEIVGLDEGEHVIPSQDVGHSSLINLPA